MRGRSQRHKEEGAVRTLGRSPARHVAGELHTNDVGGLQLPGKIGHDIDSIGTTDTNGAHAKASAVRGMRVRADEKSTGECIVFEDDLVNDTGAGTPEANVVLGTGRRQEIVDLLVDADGASEVLLAADLGLDQVVAVDGGGISHLIHASRHELQDGHLGGGILAGNAIRAQLQIGLAPLNLLTVGVIQVGIEDLLSIGERAVQASADDGEVLRHLLVVDEVVLLPVVLADLYWGVTKTLAQAPDIRHTGKSSRSHVHVWTTPAGPIESRRRCGNRARTESYHDVPYGQGQSQRR